jgi:hypothetical protein
VFGAVRHVGGEVDQIKAKIDAFEKQQAEQQQRTTYFNNVVNATTAAEKAFMAEYPDYMEAATHVRQGGSRNCWPGATTSNRRPKRSTKRAFRSPPRP